MRERGSLCSIPYLDEQEPIQESGSTCGLGNRLSDVPPLSRRSAQYDNCKDLESHLFFNGIAGANRGTSPTVSRTLRRLRCAKPDRRVASQSCRKRPWGSGFRKAMAFHRSEDARRLRRIRDKRLAQMLDPSRVDEVKTESKKVGPVCEASTADEKMATNMSNMASPPVTPSPTAG